MAQKRTSDAPKAPAAKDLSAALAALNQAAESLAASADQMTQTMQQMAGQPTGNRETPPPAPEVAPASPGAATRDEETRRFHEQLEQMGQLADVDEKTDLAALPPHITHIRRPDGSVQRIGFAASPFIKK